MLLMPKLGFLNPHPGGRIAQPEFSLVYQVQSERHRVLLEEDDESFSAERPILTSVHLDLGLTPIVLLDHPAFAEPLEELIDLGVRRQIRHIHRGVFRFVWFGSVGGFGAGAAVVGTFASFDRGGNRGRIVFFFFAFSFLLFAREDGGGGSLYDC